MSDAEFWASTSAQIQAMYEVKYPENFVLSTKDKDKASSSSMNDFAENDMPVADMREIQKRQRSNG